MNKLQVCGDCILYDGDQIAELDIHSNEVELNLTTEDMNNGEISIAKQKEILLNKQVIIQEIIRLGYTIV